MPSLLSALNVAYTSLQAHQQALEVVGNNLSNASNPAYSRQVVSLKPGIPYTDLSLHRPTTPGQIGGGVVVESLRRVRDQCLDGQIRGETSLAGEYDVLSRALGQVESVLAPAVDAGTGAALRAYFEAWHDVANQPESIAQRNLLRQRATALASSLNDDAAYLNDMRTNLDIELRQKVVEVNDLAQQIARLNPFIFRSLAAGDNPNDLLDQRDQLVEKMSRLVNVTTFVDATGQADVLLGGVDLVRRDSTNELVATSDPTNAGLAAISFARTGSPTPAITSGEIAGLLRARDEFVPQYQARLDALAQTLATQTNGLHQAGIDLDGAAGGDFFAGTAAATLRVADPILSDVRKIAASGSGSTGDGSNALALAELETARVMDGGASTLESYHQGTLVLIGANVLSATASSANQEQIVSQLFDKRQDRSGVSIDEELINLIRFQKGFEASARVVTAIDEMLDVVVRQLGTVGR